MEIREIIWKQPIVEKIQAKHGVSLEEVEYVLQHRPHLRYVERGRVQGEYVYAALGQTAAGRYLVVLVILKPGGRALPISARQMTAKERRLYGRQTKRKS